MLLGIKFLWPNQVVNAITVHSSGKGTVQISILKFPKSWCWKQNSVSYCSPNLFCHGILPLHAAAAAAAAAKSLQLCPTLCDPIDSSPPGPPIPGILQARTLEWVAISFSKAWKWKVKVKSLSVRLLVTPWTAAHQAPPSMGFSRQEYWSGVPHSLIMP